MFEVECGATGQCMRRFATFWESAMHKCPLLQKESERERCRLYFTFLFLKAEAVNFATQAIFCYQDLGISNISGAHSNLKVVMQSTISDTHLLLLTSSKAMATNFYSSLLTSKQAKPPRDRRYASSFFLHHTQRHCHFLGSFFSLRIRKATAGGSGKHLRATLLANTVA